MHTALIFRLNARQSGLSAVIAATGAVILGIALAVMAGPRPVSAETRQGGLVLGDVVWPRAGSPYLLDSDVTVPDGASLTIEAGVEIKPSPEADQGSVGFNPVIYITGGRLHIAGTGVYPVSVKATGVSVAGGSTGAGSANIEDADFTGGSYVSFENALGIVATSTFTGAFHAMDMRDSQVFVAGSRFKANTVGIYVAPHSIGVASSEPDGPLSGRFGTGGMGNALAEGDLAPAVQTVTPSLTVRGSSFASSSRYSIYDNAAYAVDAADNWWGSESGPALSGAGSVRGAVAYMPWLPTEPPLDRGVAPVCCSSVLFIPGLEGTRLYKPGFLMTNKLWEPNRNADVRSLYLDGSGSSTDPSIYSGGPIGSAYGLEGIYGGFMKMLDGLVRNGSIGEWRAFGYDWRKPVAEVVAGLEKKATSTESLVAVVEDMASRSRTGKVSIVAHSNGGLVAKYLAKILEDTGKASLIDTVVSVAVPYLGTPQAIAGLLHGDGQSIMGGLILSKATARGLGANMPSAYSLLPSAEFFSRVFKPTIVFASTTVRGLNDGSYPQKIMDARAQGAFIVDSADVRRNPKPADVDSPMKGNSFLMVAADVIRGFLDPLAWPTSIARWAVVGWNSDTAKSIAYKDPNSYRVITDPYGDGTVASVSSSYGSGQVISSDLKMQSGIDGRDIDHADILEASTTKALVSSILTNPTGEGDNPAAKNTKVLNEISKLPGITIGELDWMTLEKEYDATCQALVISTHSPVKLHAYDSRGNHTGEVPLPPELAAQVEEGLFTKSEHAIPGSSYRVFGCSDEAAVDCDSQITIPDDGSTYTIQIEGAGPGTFTLDIERVRGTSTIETVEWSGVPTTALAVASTTVTGYGGFLVSAGKSVASSTGPLTVDIDGNGAPDSSFGPGEVRDSDSRKGFILECFGKLGLPSNKHLKFNELKAGFGPAARGCAESMRERFGRSETRGRGVADVRRSW